MNQITRIILGGIGLLVLILILVFLGVLPGRKTAKITPGTIEVWGIDDESVWTDIINQFQSENKGVTVRYQQLDEATYEPTLVNRLAEGTGPDVFFLKNSLIAKHANKIYPLSRGTFNFSVNNFRSIFTDGAAEDLITKDGQILGFPLYIDTPAVFYNKDAFNALGIAEAPKTWDEIITFSKRVSKLSSAGDVIKSAIALGTFDTVEHAFEIINSIILQNGDPIVSRKTGEVGLRQPAVDAFRFYTSFADHSRPNFTWSSRLGNSLDAFAEGTSLMAIGFPEDIARIQAKNPHMNFGVVPFPQTDTPALFQSYYFPTVSRSSKNTDAAWQFIAFIAAKDAAKAYVEKLGAAPARRDLISAGAPGEDLDVFYRQSLLGKTWPIYDESATRRAFRDAIESIVSRDLTPNDAVQRVQQQLKLITP